MFSDSNHANAKVLVSDCVAGLWMHGEFGPLGRPSAYHCKILILNSIVDPHPRRVPFSQVQTRSRRCSIEDYRVPGLAIDGNILRSRHEDIVRLGVAARIISTNSTVLQPKHNRQQVGETHGDETVIKRTKLATTKSEAEPETTPGEVLLIHPRIARTHTPSFNASTGFSLHVDDPSPSRWLA